jgi:UDP:flavonoid glycosyltransferase YjiC (YdhE family)
LLPGPKPLTIRSAVERVIHEPSFRARARTLGEQIRADAAAQRGVLELEALAG